LGVPLVEPQEVESVSLCIYGYVTVLMPAVACTDCFTCWLRATSNCVALPGCLYHTSVSDCV